MKKYRAPASLGVSTRKPSVPFSQEVFDDMMLDIMSGATIRQVCSGETRPAIDTFYSWLNKSRPLAEQYSTAREVASDWFEGDIIDMAHTMHADNIAANKARFEMLRWVMARRAPKRYGDKQKFEHSGPDGGPVQEIRRIIVDPTHAPNSAA